MRKYSLLILLFVFGLMPAGTTVSQTMNPFYKLPQKGYKALKRDSLLAIQGDKNLTPVGENILEKPIEADKYLVGPGDVFSLSVLSSVNIEHEIRISPDGRAVIPDVGVVDLKNKTLAESEKIIISKAKQVFQSDNIYLVLRDIRKFKVTVSGSVVKPMAVTTTATERVSEAIEKAGGFMPDASLRKIFLKRNGQNIEIDLLRYYMNGDLSANPTLLGGDYIMISPVSQNEIIRIEGEVSLPGIFEYKIGDSLSTLLKFGQGMLKSAFLDSVEFVSFRQASNEFQTTYLDLNGYYEKIIDGLPIPNDFPLQPGDRLYVRKSEKWPQDKFVILLGEVRYPGYYPINEGKDRIKDLILRAGGFTTDASVDNSLMIRQAELKKEDPEMRRLYSLPPSEMSENERRYFQARVSEIKGVMSINFQNIMENISSEDNILLLDQDSIVIPKINSFINVQGRVNNPGYVSFKQGYTYENYIQMAGGLGFRADESAILITKSKGQQYKARDKNYIIEPGDYILVPPESETTFFDIFTTTLTIATQLITIFGVVYSVIRLK